MKHLKMSMYLLLTAAIFISCEKDVLGGQEDMNINFEEVIFQKESTILSYIPNNVTPPLINKKDAKSGVFSLPDPESYKRVGLLQDNSGWNSFLTTNGYNVVIIDQTFINNGGLETLDAIFYQRGAAGLANYNKEALKNYVLNGGILITEWDATENVMANFNISPSATLTNDYYYIGSANINVNQSHPMAADLPQTFVGGGQTQFFKFYNNLDPNFNVVASLQNDFNNDNINEPVAATYCYGNGVWVAFFSDFGDLYDASVNEEFTLAINMIEYPLQSCNLTDLDNDGILNEDDAHPNSDMSEKINIGGFSSNIDNKMVKNGSTMMDQLNDLIAQTNAQYNGENYEYLHKRFMTKLAQLTYNWRMARLITATQRSQISSIAWGATIPYIDN